MKSTARKEIAIFGKQWQFRALIAAQLIEEGYRVVSFNEIDELLSSLRKRIKKPAIVILDLAQLPLNQDLLNHIMDLSKSTHLLLCSSLRERVIRTLPPSAMVLRRPFSVGDIVKKVKEVELKDQKA